MSKSEEALVEYTSTMRLTDSDESIIRQSWKASWRAAESAVREECGTAMQVRSALRAAMEWGMAYIVDYEAHPDGISNSGYNEAWTAFLSDLPPEAKWVVDRAKAEAIRKGGGNHEGE
jgi:hypothetical protein